MPRPRFEKLSPQKRAAILEAAAREFAEHGYDSASMNKILEAAQLSKGAAYYYFDDKADLFATTVHYYASELISDLDSLVDGLTAERFWATFSELYVAQFDFFYDRPWAFGAIKAAGRLSDAELAKHPTLAASLGAVQQGVIKLIRHGQQLGVVRMDLPDDLLAALLIGVDDASDRWLLAHWETLSKEDLLAIIRRVVAGLSRMLG